MTSKKSERDSVSCFSPFASKKTSRCCLLSKKVFGFLTMKSDPFLIQVVFHLHFKVNKDVELTDIGCPTSVGPNLWSAVHCQVVCNLHAVRKVAFRYKKVWNHCHGLLGSVYYMALVLCFVRQFLTIWSCILLMAKSHARCFCCCPGPVTRGILQCSIPDSEPFLQELPGRCHL